MVQKSEKTAVPVLIQGLFDRSRSRTVDTLQKGHPLSLLTGLSLLVGGHVAREVVALLEGLAAHQTLERVLRTLPLVAEMQ